MTEMKPTKHLVKGLEISSFCIYLAWLVFFLIVWGMERMKDMRVSAGFLLVFAAIIYVLLCLIRQMPQIRMTPRGLSHIQAAKVIRLRILWIASMKLNFVCGFAGISISMIFSEKLRIMFTIAAILALLASTVYFLVSCRMVLKNRLTVVHSEG